MHEPHEMTVTEHYVYTLMATGNALIAFDNISKRPEVFHSNFRVRISTQISKEFLLLKKTLDLEIIKLKDN